MSPVVAASEPVAILPHPDGDPSRRSSRLRALHRRPGDAHDGGERSPSSLWIGALVLGVLLTTLLPLDLLLPKVPIRGLVLDRVSHEPISGARIKLGANGLITDRDGAYEFERASMSEMVQIEADGYQTAQAFAPGGQAHGALRVLNR